MEVNYSGALGEFTYDDSLFSLDSAGCLRYVGSIHGGAMIGSIPEGIRICDYMFEGLWRLEIGPVLPSSCVSAAYMFAGCTHLSVYPDIDLALMENAQDFAEAAPQNGSGFSIEGMFAGCTQLEKLSVCEYSSSGSVVRKQLDPYVCACKRSRCYPVHVSHMQGLIDAENERLIEDFCVQHPLRSAVLKRKHNGYIAASHQIRQIQLYTAVPQVAFDLNKDLTRILEQRNSGTPVKFNARRTRQPAEALVKQAESAGSAELEEPVGSAESAELSASALHNLHSF